MDISYFLFILLNLDSSIYSVKIPSVHLYIINDTVIQVSIAFSK